MFTRREIQDADKARELHAKIGRPGQKRFEKLVANNYILNCPVIVSDVKRALLIYGPDVASSKGKSSEAKPTAIPTFQPIVLPDYIMEHHMDVDLCVDFFMYKDWCFYIQNQEKLNY